jgi:CHAT domain-containing protein
VDEHDLLVLWARRTHERVDFAARVVPLTRRLLAERVAALLHPDALRTLDAWRQTSAEFFKALPATLLETLGGARRAIVIPHEVLWRVPFEAMLIENRYLAERTTVAYAPSVTALVRPPAPAVRSAETGVTFFGAAAPRLAPALADFVARTTPGWILRAGDDAERELTQIVADAPPESAEVVVQAAATEGAVRRALPDADVVHVGVPFRVNSASPLLSSMLLAEEPSGATPEVAAADGTLELREIMNLALRAQVAVLSDGTALSMRDAGDDAAMVQWGWRAAGAPSVMLARWTADRGPSEALLAEFHRRLRAGDSPRQALQTARAELRAHDAFAAPIFWAGWLLFEGR